MHVHRLRPRCTLSEISVRGGSRYSTIIVSTVMSFGLISGAALSMSNDTKTNTAHGVSLASWVRFGRRSLILASSSRFSGSALAACGFLPYPLGRTLQIAVHVLRVRRRVSEPSVRWSLLTWVIRPGNAVIGGQTP